MTSPAGESRDQPGVGGPSAPAWQRDTILRRLILFGFIVALPLLGLIIVGFVSHFRSEREHAATLLQISQQTSTQLVGNYLKSIRFQLESLERNPAMRAHDQEGMHQVFREFLDLRPEIFNVSTLDRTGLVTYSENFPTTNPPQNYAGITAFQPLFRAQDFAVSAASRGPFTGRWGCVAAIPITNDPNLLLTAPIDLQQLSHLLFLAPNENNLAVSVLDTEGTVVLSSVDPAERIGLKHPANTQIRTNLSAGQNRGEFLGLFGENRSYSAGLIRELNWVVAVSVPVDDIYREARHSLWRGLGYLFAVWLGCSFLVVAYARSITHPITALATAAHGQAGSQTLVLAPEEGPEEIAETARAFNNLIALQRQADLTLADSERRHRELFQGNPHVMYVYDLQTLHILDVNTAALQHYGYTRDEFLRLNLVDLRPADAIPQLMLLVTSLRASQNTTGSSQNIIRHKKRNGEIFTAEVTSHPLRLAGPNARLALVEDITHRLQAEEALRASEVRYRTVIDQTGQIVYDIDLPTGAIQWFGTAAVPAITGYSLEEFRQFDLTRVVSLFHPDDVPSIQAFFAQRLQTGGPYQREYRMRHRNGTYHLIEDAGVYQQDAQGHTIRALGRLSDITLRRQSEVALRQVIDLVPHLIYARDAEGRYVLCNAAGARQLGLTPETMIGKTDREIQITPDDATRFLDTDQEVLRTGQPLRIPEECITIGSGRNIWLSTEKMPFHMPGVDAPAVLGVSVDITELKLAQESRQQIEKKLLETQKLESLGVLAGGIAHDFNNLLTGILGNAGLARLELGDNPAADYLGQIEKAALRAADLCKQMLAYSGKGRVQVRRLDLNELLEDTGQLLRISISKRAALRYQLARPLPAVSVDATQIRQVVMNLVINASEAIGERSGTITLATSRVQASAAYLEGALFAGDVPPGDYICLEIGDDGSGMDAATLARIFDPFFTTKFTGRGLGLAAVLGIVRGHHGAIKVDSEPGRGTTFRILLPAVAGAVQADPPPPVPVEHWRGHGRVLVIDDEETVRLVAARTLEVLGFKVDTASDGIEALALFRRDTSGYCLVLLDLTMPRMDGEETFRQLRLLRPDMKAVLMSGFNKVEAVNRFLGKGLSGFIQKPFEIEALTAELRRVLEGRT